MLITFHLCFIRQFAIYPPKLKRDFNKFEFTDMVKQTFTEFPRLWDEKLFHGWQK